MRADPRARAWILGSGSVYDSHHMLHPTKINEMDDPLWGCGSYGGYVRITENSKILKNLLKIVFIDIIHKIIHVRSNLWHENKNKNP